MGIPLRIAEPTGRYRRDLRRYQSGNGCAAGGYCDATVTIAEVSWEEHEQVHGDNWPHDDPRWPRGCDRCPYEFTSEDHWQRNDCQVYALPDGTEFAWWGDPGKAAPPGTMIRADWYPSGDRGEAWLVVLPDGGTWITTQEATGGGYWIVTGTPPGISVSPSIHHNAPHGWHGHIQNGELDPGLYAAIGRRATIAPWPHGRKKSRSTRSPRPGRLTRSGPGASC